MPKDLTENVVALSFDVEWASAEVLADMVRLIDERGLKATFFCTHAGTEFPGHERGLHPNFRRQGDTVKKLREKMGAGFEQSGEEELYRHVVKTTHAFAPEAVGVRAHSLYYDSQLIPIYHEAGLQYDSSYALPFTTGLKPIQKEYDMLELPVYYQDHLDLKMQATGFDVKNIGLDKPGMKVCNFHPNMVFINAISHEHYMSSKPAYHDHDKLLAMRHKGKGIRTLFTDLLDHLAKRPDATMTLGEINRRYRA
jgi:peptidoglycan/xylan/chitin deacetylase (PgdA/CDA1 family)